MHTEITPEKICFLNDKNEPIAILRTPEGCVDSIKAVPGITENFPVYKITREYPAPVSAADITLEVPEEPRFYMIPGVNYNGNGFGSDGDPYNFFGNESEYEGYGCEEGPWVYRLDRMAIPACTYAENSLVSSALYAAPDGACSCSFYAENGTSYHRILWPIQEGPKVFDHGWLPAYIEEMEPRKEFSCYLYLNALPVETIIPTNFSTDSPMAASIDSADRTSLRTGFHYGPFLSAAWKQFSVIPTEVYPKEKIYDLGISYAKALYTEEPDGFRGFNIGFRWESSVSGWEKRKGHVYEIGWCGQNAMLANSMIRHYLTTGDTEALNMGLNVLDAWIKYAPLENGLFRTNMDNASGATPNDNTADACNLGTAAYQFMIADELMKEVRAKVAAGAISAKEGSSSDTITADTLSRPEYMETARSILDFALSVQEENGRFAKSWTFDKKTAQGEGTIGCFLVPPMIRLYEKTGEEKYLTAALKAFRYYRQELLTNGYTAAGALDTFCVDKESSIPLFKSALALYELTKEPAYLEDAVTAAEYLSTWQWHHDIVWPKGTVLDGLQYHTCGTTSVSTSHHHLDWYALVYADDMYRLGEYTGNCEWKERARAIYTNATQMVSDGTQNVLGKTRPAGGQDEGVLHTRWGWGHRPFSVTEWLVAWPTAFRLDLIQMESGAVDALIADC